MTINHHDATPSLTVSLMQSGRELSHISINLPTNLCCSSCGKELTTLSTPTSDTGTTLPRSLVQELDRLLTDGTLSRVRDQAFASLEWGDGNVDPVVLALRMLKAEVLEDIGKEWDSGDQPR